MQHLRGARDTMLRKTTHRTAYFVAALLLSLSATTRVSATQVVFIDFDSRTGGGERNYSTFERNQILSRVEGHYELFDFDFRLTNPGSGTFSTIFINSGPNLGIAEQIDFRNVDQGDNAQVNVNGAAFTSTQFITLTANVISHELGHLLGLRHYDSFGPIGSGIDPNTVFGNNYLPTFEGPTGANETRFHLMESDFLDTEDTFDQFFSERSAVKLAFNEQGLVVGELAGNNGTIGLAQPIELAPLDVPNTLRLGDNSGEDLFFEAIAVTGLRSNVADEDFYSFEASAGDILNIELMSSVPDRIFNTFDTELSLFGPSGTPVDYFGVDAVNDDEFESTDSILIDVPITEDGTYTVQVGAFPGGDRSGFYELFIYNLTEEPIVDPVLQGDFNDDGIVDGADYAYWRNNLGGDEALLNGNGDGLGDIGLGDLIIWRAGFGSAPQPGAVAAAPEPSAALLATLASVFGVTAGRRSRG